MSLKAVMLVLSVFLTVDIGSQAEQKMESPTVELVCKRADGLLDTELEGSLVNRASSPIDVTLTSSSFPFEVELLDKLGHDLLAKHRRPSPTYRRTENATQSIHLDPHQKKSFKLTLRQYLESRGFPKDVDQAVKLRLLLAASIGNSNAFSVFRSNVADLESH